MDDYNEQDLRRDALREHEKLLEARRTASKLPPVVWGEMTTCATCDNPTAAYEQFPDGTKVPICGECLLKEMDEFEQRAKQQHNG